MPNQVTRARRRRLDNLSRLETDLAESPGALAALAETLERGVPKRSHRGSGSQCRRVGAYVGAYEAT